jgi:hypothetical protein
LRDIYSSKSSQSKKSNKEVSTASSDRAYFEVLSHSAEASRSYLLFPALVNREKKRVVEILERRFMDYKSYGFDRYEVDVYAPRTIQCDTTFSSDVLVWGFDSYCSLGVGLTGRAGEKSNSETDYKDEIYDHPRPLPLIRNIMVERIRMIACSSRHTLLLTHFGSIYSCGDNTEGALGLGDTITR